MINAHVTFEDHFDRLDEQIERRVLEALDEGAAVMAAVATEKAGNVSSFNPMPARRTLSGWASAVSATNKKFRIFDKGSLGKRHVHLKGADRRKDSWPVRPGQANRTSYEAHREHLDTGGVEARNISNPAKLAGLKALRAALGR
jgi:hypothetical protein